VPGTLPLEGLYLRLVSAGVPISVRDYQDALVALRSGDGLHSREELRWLCETLWARTDQEVMLLSRLFRDLPAPTSEQIDRLTGSAAREEAGPKPAPAKRRRRRGSPVDTTAQSAQEAPAIEFGAATQTGIGLPRAQAPARSHEAFILSPRPLISLRALIIAWRRFRLAQRSGPKVELDIDGTVAEQCRRGTLVEPVLMPMRRNQARLVVLVDSSPSMVVWQLTAKLLVESLDSSLFANAAAYYFDNTPDELLFEEAALTRPVSLEQIRERHPRTTVLIVSDAGAARGKRNRERIGRLRAFADAMRPAWEPAAWLNPVRRDRWRGSTAESVARFIDMFELTEDGLILAVDHLRGKQAAGAVANV
jgi:uncharacterized protein with von Willebrand factor type A (vWA) domain